MDEHDENAKPSRGVGDERKNAYYSALIGAWISTKMERDRTLLALSAGGLAVLAGLLTAFRVRTSCGLVLYSLAAFSFLVSIVAGILIYERNAVYLRREAKAFLADGPPAGHDTLLAFLDYTLMASFVLGVVLTFIIALLSACSPHNGGSPYV